MKNQKAFLTGQHRQQLFGSGKVEMTGPNSVMKWWSDRGNNMSDPLNRSTNNRCHPVQDRFDFPDHLKAIHCSLVANAKMLSN